MHERLGERLHDECGARHASVAHGSGCERLIVHKLDCSLHQHHQRHVYIHNAGHRNDGDGDIYIECGNAAIDCSDSGESFDC